MESPKFWTLLGAAFATGFLAGAGIALIYAPAEGRKTRRRLRRSLSDAGDSIMDFTGSIGSRAEDAIDRGRELVGDAVSTARDRVKHVVRVV